MGGNVAGNALAALGSPKPAGHLEMEQEVLHAKTGLGHDRTTSPPVSQVMGLARPTKDPAIVRRV